MTVLVTGASGFLGGALTRALVQRGQSVRILARRTSKLAQLDDLDLEVAYGRLEDQASVKLALDGVSVVYHCAALSADWGPWEAFYQANVLGVRNILQAASEAGGLQRFLHVSTSDVYGYPEEACDESHPLTDVGLPYNRSKVLGEKAVWECHEKTGLPVTIIRPVSIFGPRSKDFVSEIAGLLLKRQMLLIDRGASPSGLIYVGNVAEGIIEAATAPNTIGQAYNLRDEANVTWSEYVEELALGLGVPGPRINLSGTWALAFAHMFEAIYRLLRIQSRPLLTRHAVYLFIRDQGYSIEKAQQDFGFRSKVSFPEGMERTLAWLDSEEGRASL
jgi:nucleoside-diphosphate-sugar epimerase